MNDTENKNITIGDVAEALGVSKTTVSRAISGKGRIGDETRQRVLDYIEANNYRPNPMAKGLADQRKYNICWAIPGDSNVYDLPFFQRCMAGVCEVTMATDYDVLISLVYEKNISHLKRIVENKKVDGVILGRTLVDDLAVKYLKGKDIPFVTIGSSNEKNVIQVDNDHENACKEITSILAGKGYRKLALIGGSSSHVVNATRQRGFELGLRAAGVDINEDMLFLGNETTADVERAVDGALSVGAECIVCMDDCICRDVLLKLRRDGISVPGDLKVASFYNSELLDDNQPQITAIQYDPKEIGNVACTILLKIIAGEEVEQKSLLGYEVLLKESTR
ncbi:MAG: LacI family DNA-binding transcriptional regulator [Butyrivibrio sp.]|nr:LacI family DNA-binding transcriptional regulator [Butyrivibrio sp.]